MKGKHSNSDTDVAIIGMACRAPGARDVRELWRNLCGGVESITFFSEDELLARGIEPEILKDPRYVRANSRVDGADLFDASFFALNAREASLMDPQCRLFLECAHEALESAGYNPDAYQGLIGVFGGAATNSYLMQNICTSPDVLVSAGALPIIFTNDKDYLTTRVSYLLNLRGPSFNVQTACSTSLVAVHLACQSLINGETSIALAGGVAVDVTQDAGYFYQEGSITSPDGHCRPFDHRASGTVFGCGVGLVVLKLLDEALEDGDTIHAVIKGSAINNDGAAKVGYTAPGVEGQAAVIAAAQDFADCPPDTISYVEAHGTGTKVGDPIELTALTRAFRRATDKKQFCALGSVKSNFGHLDAAAGVIGLIKTTLALANRKLPPSLNFERPNPEVDFENSPFFMQTSLSDWTATRGPRRAGVSAFGVGGTNAHLILEEPPPREPTSRTGSWHLLTLSAKTKTALDRMSVHLAEHLKEHPDLDLADVAYTQQTGRRTFNHRRYLVCRDAEQAIAQLTSQDASRDTSRLQGEEERRVGFMFPGQGAQYAGMTLGLYDTESFFRRQIDECAALLERHVDFDVRDAIHQVGVEPTLHGDLNQTSRAQPSLFVVEYALAQTLMKYGVFPEAMIGHSVGEYVAACLAGVFSLEDALAVVALRGRLVQALPSGVMLAIPLAEAELVPLLRQGTCLAAVNGPRLCVVSGPTGPIEVLESELSRAGVATRRLHTSHAFHSAMMDPVMDPLYRRLESVELKPPRIPFVSNLTGTWIRPEEAMDPRYWAEHLRRTVRFHQGILTLSEDPHRALLEVGPGTTLSSLAKAALAGRDSAIVVNTVRHSSQAGSDREQALTALGKLWTAGVKVDWAGVYAGEKRRRIPLPTYPFERKRYWIDPPKDVGIGRYGHEFRVRAGRPQEPRETEVTRSQRTLDVSEWHYKPVWKELTLLAVAHGRLAGSTVLLFLDTRGVGAKLAIRLREGGSSVVTVTAGEGFERRTAGEYVVNPRRREDYSALMAELACIRALPDTIVHLWGVTGGAAPTFDLDRIDEYQYNGFYSLIFMTQALGEHDLGRSLEISVVTDGMSSVAGEPLLYPDKATILGPVKVIPQEDSSTKCRSVDLDAEEWRVNGTTRSLDLLLAEVQAPIVAEVVALRSGHRFVRDYERIRTAEAAIGSERLRPGGVYLITGGLGGIGLVLGELLAKRVKAKLILTTRSPFPARGDWEAEIARRGGEGKVCEQIRVLQRLEERGAQVLVVSADVSDHARMAEAIAQGSRLFGEINGVIHAAGLPGGGAVLRKSVEEVEKVFAPKVRGTLVLHALVGHLPLDFFVLCSSVAAPLGGFGQVDYCAANAFLDAFAWERSTSGQTTLYTSIDWDAWKEVGMAVEAARRPEDFHRRSRPVAHPLLQRTCTDASERRIFDATFTSGGLWVLEEHVVIGQPTLVGTAYLEMARAAFQEEVQCAGLEMREVYFLSPLTLPAGEEKTVRTTLEKKGEHFEFVIASKGGGVDESWQEHSIGKLLRLDVPIAKGQIGELLAACCERELTFTEEAPAVHESFIQFGPRWGCVRKAALGADEELLQLELPDEFIADLESYRLHPALLDFATCSLAIEGSYLPFSYDRLRMYGPLPRRFYSHIRYVQTPSKDTLKYDVTILAEDGTIVVEVDGYTLRKIDEKSFAPEIAAAEDRPAALSDGTTTENFRLEIASPGDLKSLRWVSHPRRAPGRQEVEVELSTIGLNFKEVLYGLDILRKEDDPTLGFGFESAGKVIAVGEEVTDFAVGDEVVVFHEVPSFSRFFTTPSAYVAPKPKGLSFEQAATIPIAFLTAYQALIELGRLARGERILIHAAAGGVGQAAVQIARAVGAEIFATAGSPDKRDFLRSQGIQHVMDSRSLKFADEIMRQTGGQGVDVVLNSLSGAFLEKSFQLLSAEGRFLELGKRDFLEDKALPMRTFNRGASFFAVVLTFKSREKLGARWKEMWRYFQEKSLTPLPLKVYPAAKIGEAMEYMAQARHIGKIVISLEDWPPHVDGSVHEEIGRRANRAAGMDLRRRSKAVNTVLERDLAHGISPADGVESFNTILKISLPQVIVSTRDLRTRLADEAEAHGVSRRGRSGSDRGDSAGFGTGAAERSLEGVERILSDIWLELLGLNRVGPNDDFFNLGGHSLLAAQMGSRIRDATGVSLSLNRILGTPTIAGLVQLIQASRGDGPDAATAARAREQIEF